MRPGDPPFRRVLVANRGEIALRIIRACRELGTESVAIHSDVDAGTRHVRAADVAVRIGPAPARESYLRAERIVEVALENRAEAIHPGYGFLSERAEFAAACERAGVVFIGPASETIAALGDKLAARRAAARADVPVVPGTVDAVPVDGDRVPREVAQHAERIGWPLLVKAAAGGGGRGMRRVDRPHDLARAVVAASREAEASFGDGAVYLERFVEGGRHVEVQLLGDAHGGVVALGERDCSVQRRHQKLAEESPAPGMSGEARRALHARAVAVAQAVGLRGAATAEFLLTPHGETWFLEVNARLQVEHGVTELVTDIDLVHEQLWIAAGEPLSERVLAAADAAASPTRHAIEVRVAAEDPSSGFGPMPGTIGRYVEPGGPGVRVDSWVESGAIVPADYDPLLSKLLVVASDRAGALGRLRRALSEYEITGLQTTLPFHRWLAEHPAFEAADLATDFVERHWAPDDARAAAAHRGAEAVAEWARSSTPAREHRPPDGTSTASADGDGRGAAAWRAAGRRDATQRWP